LLSHALVQPYYWDRPDAEEVDIQTATLHNLHWFGSQLFEGAWFCGQFFGSRRDVRADDVDRCVCAVVEYLGEVTVTVLGLDQSRYQAELDAAMMERENRRHAALVARQRRMLREEVQRESDAQRGASEGKEGDEVAVADDHNERAAGDDVV
jgi:hypothetical protein